MTRLAAPPAGSRPRRATFTYGTILLFTLVTTVTGLFATPWLIRWLGEGVRRVRVLVEYAGYLAMLDLGLGRALRRCSPLALPGATPGCGG